MREGLTVAMAKKRRAGGTWCLSSHLDTHQQTLFLRLQLNVADVVMFHSKHLQKCDKQRSKAQTTVLCVCVMSWHVSVVYIVMRSREVESETGPS